MEAIEAIDRECAALGGLFQQVVNDMKTGVPHYEDFISKAGKLHGHLKNTILALGSFLDTFQKIADSATNTRGATREIGACLTRIVIRHKAMEARMKTLSSALLDCLVLPLAEKMEEWRKVAGNLDKEHSKEYKKLRQELKKKTDNQHRLVKKQSKKNPKEQMFDPKVEQGLQDVTKSVRCLHEVEKAAVRRVLVEERSRYCTFVACLKPVLGEEVSLVSELQQLEEVCTKLDKHTEDPFKLPEASEQVLADIKAGEGSVPVPVSYSPPSSPSSLGSRKSSMCSISSAGSSSGGSTNSPSHQAVQQRMRQGHPPLAAPLRLSSISSQDSGFTSQDTLFLRPGEDRSNGKTDSDGDLSGSGGSTPGAPAWPGLVQGMPGPPLTDRPHTISSAYEKGHQRPSLQPYTFNPPDKSIPEEDECESGTSRPPVPQRVSTAERPALPRQTQAAVVAKQRLQQQSGGLVPNFACTQPDAVVPQPVYMNMDDLASLANNNREEREDGLELRTPTQEDQAGLASCATSEGSSSGYGSQGTVQSEPTEHGGGNDGRGGRPPLLRPYSFTQGVPPTPNPASLSERQFKTASGQMGVGAGRGPMLRRSASQATNRPLPPTRTQEELAEAGGNSNSTTPRSSMEFLPPPPPHLLCSDEEDESNGGKLSVADSVRKLSLQQARGPSPGSLRRVQSLSAPPGHAQDRTLIMKRLDAALASPRGRGVSPVPHPGPTVSQAQQDQIYAPVAALQQKIQQQQQARLAHHGQDPGAPRHQDPGPIYAASHLQQHEESPEAASEYGFGMQFQQRQQTQQRSFQPNPAQQQQQYREQQQMQFQQQQQQFHQQQLHQQQQQHVQNPNQQQRHHQQPPLHPQQQHHLPQHQQPQHQRPQHHQQQCYNDQLLAQVDPTLAQRPLPPQHNGAGWTGAGGGAGGGQQEQVQAALRVRQWIETRTVSDVRKIRPILNQEIHQGFLLKKNGAVNDRSTPRV